MEKKLFDLSVSTSELDGYITILQPNAMFEDDDRVVIHPDQVELLIQWLKEAKDQIISQQSDS